MLIPLGKSLGSLDKYWSPFKLALHPSLPAKLRAAALDGLQRLAANKLLKGSLLVHQKDESESSAVEPTLAPSSTLAAYFGSKARRASLPPLDIIDLSTWNAFLSKHDTVPSVHHTELLIDDIITTLCSCFSISNSADDPLQLSVVKVLLTLLTSPLVEIHGASLVKVMQTVFHIHTLSRQPVHVSTAKASLTQIMNVILARMERVTANEAAAASKVRQFLEPRCCFFLKL